MQPPSNSGARILRFPKPTPGTSSDDPYRENEFGGRLTAVERDIVTIRERLDNAPTRLEVVTWTAAAWVVTGLGTAAAVAMLAQ